MDKKLTRKHRHSDCDSPQCSLFTSFDFGLALDEYADSRDLRPLTLDTLDSFIKLYAVLAPAIKGYITFTLARAHYRVPKLSTPEASRLRYKHASRDMRTTNDKETSRIWKGFLLYELACLMQGVPQMMAAASGQSYRAPEELRNRTSDRVCEEVMCVQQYAREQYDLAFNQLVESFEIAVARVGEEDLETSPPSTDDTTPIVELDWKSLRKPVQYLYEPPFDESNPWTTKMAALGISFLQKFLSWDRSNRLDFIRITHPFLSNWEQCPVDTFLRSEISEYDVMNNNFDWGHDFMDPWSWSCVINNTSVQLRLRAVGWIFWEGPLRRAAMDLVKYRVEDTYGPGGVLLPHLRLQGRRHLMEKSVKPLEWEPIVQHFGPTPTEEELKDIKGLFKSMNNLNPAGVAAVVSALCQAKENPLIEALVDGAWARTIESLIRRASEA